MIFDLPIYDLLLDETRIHGLGAFDYVDFGYADFQFKSNCRIVTKIILFAQKKYIARKDAIPFTILSFTIYYLCESGVENGIIKAVSLTSLA